VRALALIFEFSMPRTDAEAPAAARLFAPDTAGGVFAHDADATIAAATATNAALPSICTCAPARQFAPTDCGAPPAAPLATAARGTCHTCCVGAGRLPRRWRRPDHRRNPHNRRAASGNCRVTAIDCRRRAGQDGAGRRRRTSDGRRRGFGDLPRHDSATADAADVCEDDRAAAARPIPTAHGSASAASAAAATVAAV